MGCSSRVKPNDGGNGIRFGFFNDPDGSTVLLFGLLSDRLAEKLHLVIPALDTRTKLGFLILTMHLTGRIASSSHRYPDGPMNHEARTMFKITQSKFVSSHLEF
jgi:hypothetical protein